MAKSPNKPSVTEKDPFDRMRANWTVITAHRPVIQQRGEMNCGPACAEMLFADRGRAIDQVLIADGLYLAHGVRAPELADKMNECTDIVWDGGVLESSASYVLMQRANRHGTWAVLLLPNGPNHVGHWVVVDNIYPDSVVVRDPVGQAFRIPIGDFVQLWFHTALVTEEKP